MRNRDDEISAFEAKTHLSELLRETERGRSFVIRRRGKPVARLVPPDNKSIRNWQELIRSFRELRERIERRTGKLKVKELIEEGRRF